MKPAIPWRHELGAIVDANEAEVVESLYPADREDMDFMIRAVNSHHELVEALEKCVAHIESDLKMMLQISKYYGYEPVEPEALNLARAAIAKAKGEA